MGLTVEQLEELQPVVRELRHWQQRLKGLQSGHYHLQAVQFAAWADNTRAFTDKMPIPLLQSTVDERPAPSVPGHQYNIINEAILDAIRCRIQALYKQLRDAGINTGLAS